MMKPINLLELVSYNKDFLDDYHHLVTNSSGGPNPLSGEDNTIKSWIEFKYASIQLLKKAYIDAIERIELALDQKLNIDDQEIDWETTLFIFQSKWLNELVTNHYKESIDVYDPWS